MGISESLREQLRLLNFDIVEKVLENILNDSFHWVIFYYLFYRFLDVLQCRSFGSQLFNVCRLLHALQQSSHISMNWYIHVTSFLIGHYELLLKNFNWLICLPGCNFSLHFQVFFLLKVTYPICKLMQGSITTINFLMWSENIYCLLLWSPFVSLYLK